MNSIVALKNNNEPVCVNYVYVPLTFWFCENVKLAVPLVSLRSQCNYILRNIMDYDTFFINELFTEQYKEIYEMEEQHEYIEVYSDQIKINFNALDNLSSTF